ncbi:glycoside hydrolase family 2 TIM barrel-domain containing protein [Candidatus Soleaferrea massiliensis]|uniref:glycoside hydrolase family 2 TIM barrel-domain containing protein n=1 Tax=Candidatus Soleaferrea massiliensis TaxID=1470354 RepID=UPI0018CF06C9|nr:glycoside hydrolase family 2 TIM barrel-domain containing protein [Candidatus Soleaferrea massiliensis]
MATLVTSAMLLTSLSLTSFADVEWTGNEWNSSASEFSKVESLKIGREDARSPIYPFTDEAAALGYQQLGLNKDLSQAYYQSLNTDAGQDWKFYYVSNPAERSGRPDNEHIFDTNYDDSVWDDITVPKSWEATYNEDRTFRYNAPHYTNVTYPWNNQTNRPSKPHAPQTFNPVGVYRTKLDVDEKLQGRNIFLNFEGVESSFYLYVNGHKVGYSQDSFTGKEFKIDEYLNYDGTDTIALEVFKWSSGSWMEDQDFIRLAGIFRSVYLTAKDDVELRDITIVPSKTGGDYSADSYKNMNLDIYASIRDLGAAAEDLDGLSVSAKLFDLDGNEIPAQQLENADLSKVMNEAGFDQQDSFGRDMGTVKLSATVLNPALWSAEYPNLYKALVTLKDKDGEIIETTAYRFGFRVVEIRDQGTRQAQMLVNGQPFLFKGVNVHENNFETGRYMTNELIIKDLDLMKQLNFNAIRMSHYPHDLRYYELADEYGLYIIDETNIETHGDQSIPKSDPNYTNACMDRVSSMFYRTKNFPSVVIHSLGNEAGNGNNFTLMNKWLKGEYTGTPDFYVDDMLKGDLQRRPVHYEGYNNTSATDIQSHMYPSASSVKSSSFTRPYILCEYAHAHGNSNGNYQEYWDAFESQANIQGGFIWDWVDQTVKTGLQPTYDITSQDQNQIVCSLTKNVGGAGVSGEAGDKSLDGVAVAKGSPEAVNINGELTLEAWVNPADGGTGYRNILSKGDNQFQLKTSGGNIEFNTYYNGNWNSLNYKYDAGTWVGQWHHIAVTYNPANKTATLYLDDMSTPVKTAVMSNAAANGTFSKSGNDFAVGRDTQSGSGRDWFGLIDNARVYNRVLSAEELSNENRTASDEGVVYWNDFNQETTEIPPVTDWYFGFGGDWGDSPNDNNFCTNGVVSTDRIPHPSAVQLKRVHQDYVMTLGEYAEDYATVNIRSRNLFAPSSDYDFIWELKEDDTTLQTGTIDTAIAPLDNQDITISFDPVAPKDGKEYFLTMRFVLKEDKAWAEKGWEISGEQVQLDLSNPKQPAMDISGMDDLRYTEDDNAYKVEGTGFELTIDKTQGTISSFVYQGTELFAQDDVYGPAPHYFRAPTDNDRGNSVKNSIAVWKDAGKKRSGIVTSVEPIGTKALKFSVSGRLAPTKGRADYSMNFTVYGNGDVVVDHVMNPSGFSGSDILPLMGTIMQLPSQFENITWYGRGSDVPGVKSESYIDRYTKSFVDVYSGTVTDQFTPYSEVQETGNKVGTRWVALTDDNGTGLLASSTDDLLEIGALHYTPDALYSTGSTHLHERTGTDNVVLQLNYKQTGMGGDNSWGAMPVSNYILRPNQTYSYSYKLTPVKNFDVQSAMDKSDEVLNLNPISDLKVNGESIGDFKADKDAYSYSMLSGALKKVPQVDAVLNKGASIIDIQQAEDFNGTATVTAVSAAGVEKTYTIQFMANDVNYLSDIKWTFEETAWDTIRRDTNLSGNKISLKVDGQNRTFDKGILAHATSKVEISNVGTGYGYFEAYVGVDNSQGSNGQVQFFIYGDGEELWHSNVIRGGQNAEHVRIPVGGYETLTFVADEVNGNGNDHSAWADAKFSADEIAVSPDSGFEQKGEVIAAKSGTVGELKAALSSENPVEIVDKDGNVLSDDTALYTGIRIRFTGSDEYSMYQEVAVYGDADGNGSIGVSDLLQMKAAILGRADFSDAQFVATDVNEDGILNIFDLVMLKMEILRGN